MEEKQLTLHQVEVELSNIQTVSPQDMMQVSANINSKYLVSCNKLICVGECKPLTNNKTHSQNFVYWINGISPTLCAKDYKDPKRILVRCK